MSVDVAGEAGDDKGLEGVDGELEGVGFGVCRVEGEVQAYDSRALILI